jgi:hypothetical protein
MRTGVKPSVCILLNLAMLAGCETSRLAEVSWDQLVAQHPGAPQRLSDYAPANVKIVESPDAGASMEASKNWFRAWCTGHAGVASSTSRLVRPSLTAGTLHQALSLKSNAEQAALGRWRPIESLACLGPGSSDAFLGAMVIDLEPAKGSSWPVGRYKGQLTYAFFAKAQVDEFAVTYARLETERTQRFQAAAGEREDRRAEATRKLRQEPKVGDRTNVGTIIEVRPPMVLMQYDERYRAVSSRPATEWVRIDSLSAPSEQ